MKNLHFAILGLAIALIGCSDKNVLNHDIVLTKYDPLKSNKSTEKGSLNVNVDKAVDQVIIKRGTKGRIVEDLGNEKYAVSFEPDESKVLVYGKQTRFGVYYLQALEWDNGRGKVQYGDQFYFTNAGADQFSLLFNINKSLEENREVRVAKGNKVK
jgi:hypothetical protein